MDNQGRSKRQIEDNYKILKYVFIIFISTILISIGFELW